MKNQDILDALDSLRKDTDLARQVGPLLVELANYRQFREDMVQFVIRAEQRLIKP